MYGLLSGLVKKPLEVLEGMVGRDSENGLGTQRLASSLLRVNGKTNIRSFFEINVNAQSAIDGLRCFAV